MAEFDDLCGSNVGAVGFAPLLLVSGNSHWMKLWVYSSHSSSCARMASNVLP
ncbi:hypothetical protein [Sulfuricella sp.]|uniref:hypothetical protein n=1 Tax=Sulfuricella sp. TaxID=2099377 RepID=UPI002C9E017E|nr:hypothetical protein [Sulfuricella sp.]HUX62146.1 hypothetical protein [Sulfuricella sp.]